MTPEKQIEEMCEVIRQKTFACQECEWYKEGLCIGNCVLAEENQKICTDLYDAGYRKASEIAEEIFAEIEKSICNIRYDVSSYRHTHIPIETMVEVCNWILQKCIPDKIAELKKKYLEVQE